jgi:hypothetical protein
LFLFLILRIGQRFSRFQAGSRPRGAAFPTRAQPWRGRAKSSPYSNEIGLSPWSFARLFHNFSRSKASFSGLALAEPPSGCYPLRTFRGGH